jgi:hypothetical protein
VTCLSREGCRPERLRQCINITALACSRRDFDAAGNEEDETPSDEETSFDGDDDDDDEGMFYEP